MGWFNSILAYITGEGWNGFRHSQHGVFFFFVMGERKKEEIHSVRCWVGFVSFGKERRMGEEKKRGAWEHRHLQQDVCSFAHGLFYGLPSPSSARVKG